MEHNQNPFATEAATDEPASPVTPLDPAAAPLGPEPDDSGHPAFASEAEEEAYRKGVSHGIRSAGREPGHPHMPADFSLDLTRGGAAPGLVSGKLLEAWPHIPGDEASAGSTSDGFVQSEAPAPAKAGGTVAGPARAPRHDGWTPEKERIFCETLANTGVVADACRAARMSRDAAYTHRRRASGRAFALGWDAALLISRGAIADDVMSRSRHGVIDRVYRNGELVAERHRYDNRLTMAVLSRLDRLAEGLGENAPVVRAVAQEYDRFLDLLPEGVEGAEQFVAARFAPKVEEPPSLYCEPPTGSELARLARLAHYQTHGVGLPIEIDTGDLDPEEMERWSDEQWDRAESSGFLRRLHRLEWPESAREPAPDESNGMCKLRKLYLRYHPEPAGPAAPDRPHEDGFDLWEDEDEGCWMTGYPPPQGFDGDEEGEWGEDDYKRTLSAREQAVLDADLAVERAEQEAELAGELARARAARDRCFGFAGDATSSSFAFAGEGDHPKGGGGVPFPNPAPAQAGDEAIEPAAGSDIVRSGIREGESE